MEINERIEQLFREAPNAEAIIYEGQTWTWADLARVRDGLDALLQAAGIGAGEGVGLVLRQRATGFGAYVALLNTRRCAALVTPIQPDAAMCEDLRALRPKALIADPDDWARQGLVDAAAAVGALGIELTGDRDHPARLVPGLERPSDGPHYTAIPNAAVTILTSGTTGPPKRVPVSYDTLRSSPPKSGAVTSPGASIGSVPLVTLGGVMGTVATLWRGRPTELMERFDIWRWAELVKKYQPRRLAAPPAVIRMLLDNKVPREYLASAKLYRAASAPLDPNTAEEFEAAYGIPVVAFYGATEFLGSVTGFETEDLHLIKEKRGSVGRALPGIGVRVVDPESGRELPRGQVGLVEADPKIRPADAPPGFIRTNDLGHMDEDGFLWIEGRADDVVIRGGFKVATEEVASVLREHPAVADAAVVGLPDPRVGQVPAAAVVLRQGADAPSPEALMDWVRERKPGYCVPEKIAFVDALPRNTMFKVLRKEVASLIENSP